MPNVAYEPRVPGVYEAACWTRHGRDLAVAYPDGLVPPRADGPDPQRDRRRASQHPKGYWFNPDAAEHPITFIERHCKHHKGEWAGQPLILQEWQRRIIRIVFGWLRPDGTRRFRIAYIELPRKNGKSELAGALGLYLLAADHEPGAEVYCLDPATPVLRADLQWVPVGDLRVGDGLVAFDEHPVQGKKRGGHYRKLRPATVQATDIVRLPSYRLTFEDGRSVVASGEHLWLAQRAAVGERKGWVRTDQLAIGSRVRDFGAPWGADHSHAAGYLAGVFDGEGCLFLSRKHRAGFRMSFGQRPGVVMDRTLALLAERGIPTSGLTQHKSGVESFTISGAYHCMRLLGEVRPLRLLAQVEEWYRGHAINRGVGHQRVRKIEPLGTRRLVALGTSTRTLFANGFFSHNCSATKKDQAKIVHDTATAMVQASADLQRVILIQRNSLTVPRLLAKMEPLGADSDTLDGLNPHGNIVDELHAHKDRHVWDVMDTAMGARRQPLTLAITTAGLYNPESIGYEQHTHALNVLTGAVDDDAFFAFVACASETDDPFVEATWRTANPNYGVSVKPEHMAEQAAKAKSRPSFLNAFLRLHLDRWTLQHERWLDVAKWIAGDDALTPNAYAAREAALAGQVCYAGLDLSARIALTALVLVFPLPNDRIELLCRFWIPEARLTDPTAQRDRVPYDAWVRDGWLRTTPGDVVQHSYVRAELVALAKRYDIREVALDPWNSTELANQLQDEGFATDPRAGTRVLVEVPQQAKHLSEACKRFEELIVGGRVRHGGHPVLRHHVASVAKREDVNGNIAPDKKASSDRIDGVTATVNALSRLIAQPTPTGDSPWLLFQIGAASAPNESSDAESADAVRT